MKTVKGGWPVAHAIEAGNTASATGHINTICYMHAHHFIAALITNDEDAVKRHVAAQALLAEEYKLVFWQRYATVGQERHPQLPRGQPLRLRDLP